jgi:Phosphoribulokinase / Uridine kinase family
VRRPPDILWRYDQLARWIQDLPASCGLTRLVAIDGHGGAGKSLFAGRLAAHLGNAPVVHTDDFASWDEPINWWPQLEAEVLEQLGQGEVARFRAYDWSALRLGDWRQVPPAPVVLLEGVSSSRQAVASRLSLAIWIQTPADVCLARGIERDGEPMRDQWHQWMVQEAAHFARDLTRERAHLAVDGAPDEHGVHDPDEEFLGQATGLIRPMRVAHQDRHVP